MYGRILVLLIACLTLAPACAAQSTGVRVRIVPQFEEVALAPGERGGVDMDVTLEVRTTCQQGTEFGVTVVFASSFPSWAGASPEPANLQFDHDGGTQKSRLTIFPAEDAPPGETVTYMVRPEVKLPGSGSCTGQMNVDGADASVKLTILGPDQTGQVLTSPEEGGRSPGFSAASLGLLLLGSLFLRRRL